ncbi:holin [Acinetobacter modestus]|uniref:holin n=1 Tax=Acinetobacter modestus TaxID=1776740 RepID=UPI00301948EC
MSEYTEAAIETSSAVTTAAAKTTVVGGVATASAKILGLDPITLIGLVVAIGGLIISIFSFLINWYYKRQENKRAEEIHKLERDKLLGKLNVKQD